MTKWPRRIIKSNRQLVLTSTPPPLTQTFLVCEQKHIELCCVLIEKYFIPVQPVMRVCVLFYIKHTTNRRRTHNILAGHHYIIIIKRGKQQHISSTKQNECSSSVYILVFESLWHIFLLLLIMMRRRAKLASKRLFGGFAPFLSLFSSTSLLPLLSLKPEY